MILRRLYIKGFLFALILLMLCLWGFTVHQWLVAKSINQTLHKIAISHYLDPKNLDLTHSESQFAYAYHLQQTNQFQAALNAYIKAERMEVNHPDKLKVIRYNVANLYLKQALEKSLDMGVDSATALADAAKQFYRVVLEIDPNFWSAKFNYEAAQRLVRDLPQADLPNSKNDSKAAPKDLWSALPDFPRGAP